MDLGRKRLWSVAIAISLVLFVASAAAASAEAKRFSGYTEGYIGPDHDFVVGDGFSLVFVDRRQSNTPYRVCWHRLHHAHHRCWLGETGAAGRLDRIFTAAPGSVGTYIVKWSVRGHRKARWTFHNGVGD
ncbi:MAG TPA: hypothetical protein VFJ57_00225 [Solirubrobacterales bacterium]|nr:hypothetical protein [Solirubrobacterales bacterium]